MTASHPAAPIAAFEAGWNAGDGSAIGAAFAVDAQFVNILGGVLDGREAIARQHQRILDGLYRGTHAEFPPGDIRRLDTGHALVTCDAVVRNVAHAPPGIAPPADGVMRTRLVFVTADGNDGWRIVFAQNTVVMAMPG